MHTAAQLRGRFFVPVYQFERSGAVSSATRRRAPINAAMPVPIPNVSKHAVGTSIGAIWLCAVLPTYGIRFCPAKPPRLPIALIAATLAAARAPEKKRGGSDQKHG